MSQTKSKNIINGQKILVIKNGGDARVGDLAVECGYSHGMHQFHSTYLQPSYDRDEIYWVEFLGDDSFVVIETQSPPTK